MPYDIKVVNINKYKFDDVVYIGRGSPLGNPFTSKDSKLALYKVDSTEIAVSEYKKYLYKKISEKDRAITYELKIILAYLKEHKTIALGCYCKGENYKHDKTLCHGDIIKELLLKLLT